MAHSVAEQVGGKKRDFILLSEFAEIRHGPQPICTIPEGGEGSFDITAFSVRVFSTDFQQGQSEDFAISLDSQVLLTEPSEGLFVYVHYFALNDIEARGYLRQYCLSYLTSSPSKLIDHFQLFKNEFTQVVSLFKCGNHSIFKTDLTNRLSDLMFSLRDLAKNGVTEPENGQYNVDCEDIPEVNREVLLKDTEFTKQLVEIIDKEMSTESNINFREFIDANSCDIVRIEGNSHFYTTGTFTRETYKPRRVMAHLSQRFTRQQRSLNKLSSRGYSLAMNRLVELHKKYCRSEVALSMELLETELINPLSSLLVVGRVPLMNVLDPPLTTNGYNNTYKLTASSQEQSICHLQDLNEMNSSDILKEGDWSRLLLYLDPLLRQRIVSVVDPLGTPHNFSLQSPDPRYPSDKGTSSYNTPETIPTPPLIEPYATPPLINPSEVIMKLNSYSNKEVGPKLNETRKRSSTSTIQQKVSHNELTRSLPQPHSLKGSAIPRNLRIDSYHQSTDDALFYTPMVTCPQNHLNDEIKTNPKSQGVPFISSVDLVENKSSFKPGKDLVTLFKDIPELRDILYCLLVGRPLIIIANPRDEKLVRRHIRSLWLFVAGYSSQYQVVPWQEYSFELDQMVSVRLAGVMSPTIDRTPPIPNHLKRHVSCWDWTSNTLNVPTYKGSLLNPILSRSRDKKNEELFLVLIESILLDLSLKTFVYYHGYCLQSEQSMKTKQPSPPEAAPCKRHAVLAKKDKVQFLNKLSIKEGDTDIVEHFTRVIKDQQLSEFCPRHSERPPKVTLKGYHCQERVCKPKRPT